jgi:multidrug efflux pump subunit AcrB
VARKIENAVATLQGVKHIYGKVHRRHATITVEFRLEKPTQEAVDDVRDAVSRVRADLPADMRDPQISKMNLSGAPILTYTVASSRMDAEALSWFVDNDITKALLSINGVGSVARVGGVTREVQVNIDPARLLALGATVADVSRQLRAVQQDASGGRTDWAGPSKPCAPSPRCSLRPSWGSWTSRCKVAAAPSWLDLATVTDTVAEQRSVALLDGKPVVGFEITRSRGASEVEVDAGVSRVLAELKTAHPGVVITQAFNMVDPVIENYDGSLTLLYEGRPAGRAGGVVLFARLAGHVRGGGGVAAVGHARIHWHVVAGVFHQRGHAAEPVAGHGHSGGRRHRRNREHRAPPAHGQNPYQAAMEAADEIGLAVIATTFTLIAVFLPTAFMSGIPGKFFKQFGWTAALAVFASLVVARVLTPMMAAYLLKPIAADKRHVPDGRIMRGYLASVAWCLKHRLITALAAGAFFVGSIMRWCRCCPPASSRPMISARPRSASSCRRAAPSTTRSPRPSRRARWSAPTRMCSASTPRWVAAWRAATRLPAVAAARCARPR